MKKRLTFFVPLLLIIGAILACGNSDTNTGTIASTLSNSTPTALPTTEQRILAIASEHKGTDSVYSADQKSFETKIKLGAQWDDAGARDSVKMECYDLQKALWTASPTLDLESVVIFIHGNTVDQYGNEKVSQVGHCTLKKANAANFNWQNLTWRTAWDVYDYKSLAPFLQRA